METLDFGPGRAVPLDRNAKYRLSAYARAWDRKQRLPGTLPAAHIVRSMIC